MLLLLVFAFLAGIVTILSPCILPVLPIVLSGSLASGRRRPLGIVTGFVVSFTFFTLMLTAIVKATGISSDALRIVAVAVIALFGFSLLLPQTQAILEKITTKLSGITPRTSDTTGYWGGLIVGLSLGLIWTPCVGPILAAVITLAITQTVNAQSFLITFAYSLGSALPMLGITYGSQKLLKEISFFHKYTAQIQKGFGVVMILTALAIYLNLDRQFQTWVLVKFPAYGTGLTAIENNASVQKQLDQLRGAGSQNISPSSNSDLLSQPKVQAPDFTGGGNWLNSQPLSLKKELKGKVVLVDFWTYSCINCLRTLPYLKDLYANYKDKGFVLVGVHSPEFEFERVTANVTKAVTDLGITYPVVQDNDFKIWQAYTNQYWPAHYLIDKDGFIRYTHFGEGNYVETENAVRALLDEQPVNKSEPASQYRSTTPETYLGYTRGQSYTYQNDIRRDSAQTYHTDKSLEDDAVGLSGDWQVKSEQILAKTDGATLKINFKAQQVYLVMANPNNVSGKVVVTLDGSALPEKYLTGDMDKTGAVLIKDPRKYDLIDLKDDYGRHELEITFPAGVEAYAFTFGS